MKRIAGISIIAIRIEKAINRRDGVINIGIGLEDEFLSFVIILTSVIFCKFCDIMY